MTRTSNTLVNEEGPLEWKSKGKVTWSLEPTISTADVERRQDHPRHELLGSRVSKHNGGEHLWENDIDIREVPWLAEHALLNQICFPAAGYIAMAGESMRQLSNGDLGSYALKDFSITSPLLLKPDEKLRVRTRLRPSKAAGETTQWHDIHIASHDGSRWVERCVSKVFPRSAPSSNAPDIQYPKDPLQRRVARAYWYDALESRGLRCGPVFQGLGDISTALEEHEAVATISPTNDKTEYIIHPITIDQSLQILMIAACKGQSRQLTGIPIVTAIERLVVFGGQSAQWGARGTVLRNRSGGFTGEASVMSQDNHPALMMRGCEISLAPNGSFKSKNKLFSFVKWDTDAGYRNLNQALSPSSSRPNSSTFVNILKPLSHKNAKLRVLELGNGGEETTRLILDALKSEYGDRLYLTYTYAATSFDAALRAKEALMKTKNINFVFFDVELQTQGQILQNGAYDLIVTAGFISSARNDVKARIECLKHLMHPLGHLLLLDTLPGFRTSRDDSFVGQVHIELSNNGFAFGPEDDGSWKGLKVVAELRKPPKRGKRITLVVPDDDHPLVNAVQASFKDCGISCDRCTFDGKIPQGQDMILLMDFGEPYLYNMTESRFRDFANRLSNFKGSIIWVTPSAQISCSNPDSSLTLGMTRTLRAELRKDITVAEIDTDATTFLESSRSLMRIYQGLNHRLKAKDVDPDYEYAIVDGDIKIPRIHWTTLEQELPQYLPQLPEYQSDSQSHNIRFRSDACYLLVGGLGGLGRVISTWMVENGARCILFLSRSAKEGPEHTPFFDELRAQGCEVLTFAGSVTELSDVEAAVKQATKPVAGIMQMSAVMRDNWMSHMTFKEWHECVRPKVQGTWNLHQATLSSSLDFFLLFSSVCGMSGQWGQANYNSANAFLDAFVNYRHGQDLSASVVDIGFMGCIGMAVENKALVEKLTTSGYHYLGEQDLIDALTMAIGYSHPGKDRFMNKSQLGLGFRSTTPLTSPSNRVVWKKDARFQLSHQYGPLGTVTDEQARDYLEEAYQTRGTSE